MKLQALDLVKSYGPDSPGREARTLVDRNGTMRLGSGLWSVGQRAIDVLDEAIMQRGDEGLRELDELVPALIREWAAFLDDEFLASLLEALEADALKFRVEGEPGNSEGFDLSEAWAAYDFPDKVELFTQFIGNRPDVLRDFPDLVSMVQDFSAVAVLVWLDDALIADFCDGRGLHDVVAGIEKLRPHLDIPVNAFAVIDAVRAKARTDSAKVGAMARHAENHAMKQEVFAWLDEHFPECRSMDAAATAIAGKVAPIAWRTARDWVAQWKKLRPAGRP